MGLVHATITMSLDGFITGLDDGPGCGLGVGGERLHYWVFGGPWSYDSPARGEPFGEDKAWLEETLATNGAVVAGRGTYEAAGRWGDKNRWGIPFFVVTHRPEEQPDDDFVFVGGLAQAIELAKDAAGNKQVNVMGGAQIIGQTLAAGLADQLNRRHRPAGTRCRQATLRRSQWVPRVRARRCPTIALRNLCRVPREEMSRQPMSAEPLRLSAVGRVCRSNKGPRPGEREHIRSRVDLGTAASALWR